MPWDSLQASRDGSATEDSYKALDSKVQTCIALIMKEFLLLTLIFCYLSDRGELQVCILSFLGDIGFYFSVLVDETSL